MDEYLIDLSGVTDKDSLHRCLRDALPLPEWYGNNLDALYDSMTEMSVPVTIRFLGSEKAQDRLGDYFEMFRRVLQDVQSDLPGLTVLFEEVSEDSFEEAPPETPQDPDLEKIYKAQGEMEDDGNLNENLAES